MVSASAAGRSVTIRRSSIGQGTPLTIICSASSMMNGMMRMNVKTSSAITNGGQDLPDHVAVQRLHGPGPIILRATR